MGNAIGCHLTATTGGHLLYKCPPTTKGNATKIETKPMTSNFKALENHLQAIHPEWTQGEINSAAIEKVAVISGFWLGYSTCKGQTPDMAEVKQALKSAGLLKYAQICYPELYGTSELWKAARQTIIAPSAQQQKRKIKKTKKTQRRLPKKQGIALFRPRRK